MISQLKSFRLVTLNLHPPARSIQRGIRRTTPIRHILSCWACVIAERTVRWVIENDMRYASKLPDPNTYIYAQHTRCRGSSSYHLYFECDTERAICWLEKIYGDYEAIWRDEKFISSKGDDCWEEMKNTSNMVRDKPLNTSTIHPIHIQPLPQIYTLVFRTVLRIA